MGNLRNKPSTGKTPPFLIFRYCVYQPFTLQIYCSSDPKNFANSRPSASNFQSFFHSRLEQFWKQNPRSQLRRDIFLQTICFDLKLPSLLTQMVQIFLDNGLKLTFFVVVAFVIILSVSLSSKILYQMQLTNNLFLIAFDAKPKTFTENQDSQRHLLDLSWHIQRLRLKKYFLGNKTCLFFKIES